MRHEINHLVPTKVDRKRATKARRAGSRAFVNSLARTRKNVLLENDFVVYRRSLEEWRRRKKKGSKDFLKIPENLKPFRTFIMSDKAHGFEKYLLETQRAVRVTRAQTLGKFQAPLGHPWNFSLFPLSKTEERTIAKERRWHPLRYTRQGDYLVTPERYDLKVFQRKFWIARKIRTCLARLPFLKLQEEFLRNTLLFLRKVTHQELRALPEGYSDCQSVIFSSIYYLLRRNSLKDHRSLTVKL
jgi:hypothetical protein